MAFESDLSSAFEEQMKGDGEVDFDKAQLAAAEGVDDAPDFMVASDEDDLKNEKLPPVASEEEREMGIDQ